MAEGIRAQDVIVLIVYLVIIILAAYYLTKLVAKKSMQKGMKQTSAPFARKRIQQNNMVYVVDRIPIDRDKSIMVVEFEKHYYLVGVTQTDFKLLDKKEISKEELIKRAREAVLEQERQEAQSSGNTSYATDEPFSKRFFASFKQVSSNYFKKDKSNASFDEKLQSELNKQKTNNSEDKKDVNTK